MEKKGFLRRPIVPPECTHNAHMYYVLLSSKIDRQMVLDEFSGNEISAVFHYVPLHSSPGGRRYGRTFGNLSVTNSVAERLIRLPLWIGLTEAQQERVVAVLTRAVNQPKVGGIHSI
ncbi:DegT/DnrJ/EryC1/StrS family aminotransferase [bacterium]|nr:DegT/DnrJ/EryC1/StrS family aminotransferase [bacterium]